ncbi:hypothetical protein ACH0CM_12435 [Streptomyces albus]|uniref:hypothetical protein n=1 Tax=Streptomyces albus TaxID=1888 RepID=UPI0038792749
MSSFFDGVEPQVYEVTWMSGHVEKVRAHQVTHSALRQAVTRLGDGFATSGEGQRIKFHAQIDGQWTLQLSALEDDIRTIRNVSAGEPVPGGDQS